nr:DUF3105 domain-containing protein [Motilibacter deserti]
MLGVVGVLVLVGVVAVAVLAQRGGSGASAEGQIIPSTPTGETTVERRAEQVEDDSGIEGVLAWNTGEWPGDGTEAEGALEHDHVDGPVQYAVVPPVGGPHNGVWMNAGVYTEPIPSERAVHNMEHGAVWITYRPSLPTADVEALRALVTKQTELPEPVDGVADAKNRYVDLSPWADESLPSPIVISAWGHQLRVDSPDDPRLQQFVDTFRSNQKYTPEYGSAVDGIPVETGGRAAYDGINGANPPGKASGDDGM